MTNTTHTTLMMCLALTMMLTCGAGAATRTVNASATAGGMTYATIQAAVDAATPGDVIVVAPGVYDERVTVATSGEAGSLITVKADPARKACVKGFDLQGDYIAVEGFEITSDEKGANGIDAGQTHLKTARTGCRMTNNFIHDITGTAVYAGTKAVVKGNLMRKVHRGVFANSGTLIEDNEVDTLVSWEIEQKGEKRLKKTQYTFFSGDDITIRGNYFHGSPMERMHVWGVDFFTTWDAWIFSSSNRILIENNRCFNATHACEPSAEARKESSHITFRNNLFVNTVYVGILCKQWSHITIENNTFVNCGAYPIWFQTPRETEGARVRNNLITYIDHDKRVHGGPKAETGIANFAVRKDASATIDCDYNMHWNCQNVGFGKHDFVAEPVFVDPAKGDYRLKAGSPGIDAGETLEAVKTDLLGVKRPQGRGYDVGAYEFTPGKGAE